MSSAARTARGRESVEVLIVSINTLEKRPQGRPLFAADDKTRRTG
jgi:hypothetical protein